MGTAAFAAPAAVAASGAALAVDLAVTGGVIGASATGVATGSILAEAVLVCNSIALASVPAGPFGWVIGAGALMSGLVIIAGEEEKIDDSKCWQQVLNSGEMPDEKAAFHEEHGILLPTLVAYCGGEIFKDEEDGKLVVRNKKGEHFAFSISTTVPAADHPGPVDIVRAHAVPVDCHCDVKHQI